MTKRKSLTKTKLKTGANSSSGSIVSGSQLKVLNPGPSQQAMDRIERYEESSLRAEQRLGLTRLI